MQHVNFYNNRTLLLPGLLYQEAPGKIQIYSFKNLWSRKIFNQEMKNKA